MKRFFSFLVLFFIPLSLLSSIEEVLPIPLTLSHILSVDELDIISSHEVELTKIGKIWQLFLLKENNAYKIIYYDDHQVGEFSVPGNYSKKDPPLLTFQQLDENPGNELLVYSSKNMKLEALYTFNESQALLIFNSALYNQFPLYINFDSFLRPYIHINYQKELPIPNPNNYKNYIKKNELDYIIPIPLLPTLLNSSLFRTQTEETHKTVLSLQFAIRHPITSGVLTTLWELKNQNWELDSCSYQEYSIYKN